MNAQERNLLVGFLDQLIAATAAGKDAEADALIREACARQPDACYLLTQRALQLEQALEVARHEIDRLQRERGAAATGEGFLGSASAWGRSPANTTPTGALVSAPPAAPPPGKRPDETGARSGRFHSGALSSAAAAAAGVVAGSFLFQGVQNLLGHRAADASSRFDAPGTAPEDTVFTGADPAPLEDADLDAGWDDGGDGGDFA